MAIRLTFTVDGWLKTGDKGYIDKDGYLFIKGRSKNLIVGPSEENIYPEEIELHISQNNFVLESLVYELEGHIVARVHLDYDAIDKEIGASQMQDSRASKEIQKILDNIKRNVNKNVASCLRIYRIIEQSEEFVKTPQKNEAMHVHQ